MTDATRSVSSEPSLGPAMRFVLAIAYRRRRERAASSGKATRDADAGRARTTLLWELAERYHPEEAWLAESYVLGERTREEMERAAPRSALAPSLVSALRALPEAVHHQAILETRVVPKPAWAR